MQATRSSDGGTAFGGSVRVRKPSRKLLYLSVALLWCGLVAGYVSLTAFGWLIWPPLHSPGLYFQATYAMSPTVSEHEMLLIWWNYYRLHEPKRGDLVVYDYPADRSLTYLSRVVGRPGDRIQVKDGILQVNGQPVERELIEVRENPELRNFVDEITTYREKLPNGRRYHIEEYGDATRGFDNTPEYLVPGGHYFVLDDNRDRGQDSRDMKRIGFVERAKVQHFPTFVVWSEDWNRIGTRVQPLP